MSRPDTELEVVLAYFRAIPDLEETAGNCIRQAYDEVFDGARTRRYCYDELDKEEKTYIGKKVEIILRNALKLSKGRICDLTIKGIEVDIKWLASSAWMIPQENFGKLCLVLAATETPTASKFRVGLIRADLENLTTGENQDKKKQISAQGKKKIVWLVEDGVLPPNFLLKLPKEIRERVMVQSDKSGQAGVNELLRLVQRTPIPRVAFDTVAHQVDGPKRARDARKPLNKEGLDVLGGRYDQKEIKALDLPHTGLNEWISYKLDS